VVQDTDDLRNQVHAVYYNMLNRLRENDIDGALKHFTASRRENSTRYSRCCRTTRQVQWMNWVY